MYFVDSRFQEGPRAGLCLGVPEVLCLGLFLAGLILCRSASEHTVHASKEASDFRRAARPEREPRPSARLEKRLPKSNDGSSANGSSNGQSLNTWNQEIDQAAKAANPTLAEDLFDRVLRAGLVPDAVSYNSVIHACAKAGALTRAERWLTHMKSQGTIPNVITYNILMDGYAKADNARGA